MRTPKKGTLQRAVFDAMHATWCGSECAPSCRAWHPSKAEQDAAIKAVRDFDAALFERVLARELGQS